MLIFNIVFEFEFLLPLAISVLIHLQFFESILLALISPALIFKYARIRGKVGSQNCTGPQNAAQRFSIY